MHGVQPSLTARGAAVHRAAHQVLEGGAIFSDPLACAILGAQPDVIADEEAADPSNRPIRLFIAARSRFAEDALSYAAGRGVRQAVVLGAGFDTFGLRNPYAHQGLGVFEVDYPATQAWKRDRLAQMSIDIPRSLIFAPVDFERGSLVDGLAAVGFRLDQPAFFLWLGVVPYLTREAIYSTLRFIAGVPASEVVFDYCEPPETSAPERRAYLTALAARVAAAGEPFLSHFDPAELAKELPILGFAELEDIGLAEIAVRFFGAPKGGVAGGAGPHVIRARRVETSATLRPNPY
jgi:methyltransferase (TIGR00027 family)